MEPDPHDVYEGGLEEDPEGREVHDPQGSRAAYVVVNVSRSCRRLHK